MFVFLVRQVLGAQQPFRCPRYQRFDLKLFRCVQCKPCKTGLSLHPYSCQCKCLHKTVCANGDYFDVDTCRCVSRATVCNNTACPGSTVLDPTTCACSCPAHPQCNSLQSLRQDTCECVCNSVMPAPERTRTMATGTRTGSKSRGCPGSRGATPNGKRSKTCTKGGATPKNKNKPKVAVPDPPKSSVKVSKPAATKKKPRRDSAHQSWRLKPRHVTLRSETSKRTPKGTITPRSRTGPGTRHTAGFSPPSIIRGDACPLGQSLNKATCQCMY